MQDQLFNNKPYLSQANMELNTIQEKVDSDRKTVTNSNGKSSSTKKESLLEK